MQNRRSENPTVLAVNRSATHSFSKGTQDEITLITGLGIEGDAHMGATVKHRSRIKLFGKTPNLRQVHLIHSELHDQLNATGFHIQPGDMGENITTKGLDILSLPADTILKIGAEAAIRVTGLRNPCKQLDRFQKGLMKATLEKDTDGQLIRKAGIMSVVVKGGRVRPGDTIQVILPESPHQPLAPV